MLIPYSSSERSVQLKRDMSVVSWFDRCFIRHEFQRVECDISCAALHGFLPALACCAIQWLYVLMDTTRWCWGQAGGYGGEAGDRHTHGELSRARAACAGTAEGMREVSVLNSGSRSPVLCVACCCAVWVLRAAATARHQP